MFNNIERKKQSLEEMAELKFEELKKLPGVKYAFNLILQKLPEKYPLLKERFEEVLPYHGKPHAEDVLHEAVLFGLAEGISAPRDFELLALAAAFHDSGFIKEYDKNESIGAEIAAKYMRESGEYTEAEIERVREAILSTQVSFESGFKQLIQNSNDILQRVLADADVSNFGREDFEDKAERLFQELLGVGKVPADNKETRLAFNKFRERMLETHQWNTGSALHLREEQKKKNWEILRGL